MVNKYYIVSNNHYSLVTSAFLTIGKSLNQFYLINQLLLLICLPNVNITRLTASEDVAPIELIPDWFFEGIKPNFSIVYRDNITRHYSCEFLLNTKLYAACKFSLDNSSLIPTKYLQDNGNIDIKLTWKMEDRERFEALINLERRLIPNFISINLPSIYCCIKGPNLTFTGSNFYSLFQPKISYTSLQSLEFCYVLDNYTLTCNRPFFENATIPKLRYSIRSHGSMIIFDRSDASVYANRAELIIEPLPHLIWAISRPQLSVIIRPTWVEFVDPVIIKVYKRSGDLLVECTVQVNLQSNWLTCDKSTPKEETSTLLCFVTFGTRIIEATADATITTLSDDADSNGSSTAILIIILVVLILIFLACAVYLFHVKKLLTRKLSSTALATLSTRLAGNRASRKIASNKPLETL